ncbi:MAG: alpha/beta fold hydrolase [Moraxellaceae bacterium]|nr:alpha/beta fold hydrolase [Moraxellaceae bacterium]
MSRSMKYSIEQSVKRPDLFAPSGDVRLAIHTWGEPPTPARPREVLVLVHGFPDRALFWEKVADALREDFYVVAFDMRGCGNSTPISGRRHYHFTPLLNDLYAVIDTVMNTVSPGQKVHLVGHDWGGIYGWDAIGDPEGSKRIASFITMSPSLDHVGFYLRRRFLKPTPRNLWQAFGQLARNSLMTFFTLPLLPELLFRSGLGALMFRRLVGHYEPRITFRKNEGMEGDAIRYLGIYRANLLQRVLFPKVAKSAVPVHVVMAVNDPFLPPAVFEVCPESTARYSASTVDAAHWAPLSRPQELAAAIATFVLANAAAPITAADTAHTDATGVTA